MERLPAVAGRFYPADPGSLVEAVESCLPDGERPRSKVVAVMVPHAGYQYSGPTAGRVLASIPPPQRVVLLGPNHTGLGRPAAVWTQGAWRTPLGAVPVDEDLAGRLVACHPDLEADHLAHLQEHSLEVQIPFLQHLACALRIVPVCLAGHDLQNLLQIGQKMGAVLKDDEEETLLLISSDMTHYESRQAAALKDHLAISHLEAVDPSGLFRTVQENKISMCGVVPAVVGLEAARHLGARRGRLVDYSCSGDVTGDNDQVVAYAGLTFA